MKNDFQIHDDTKFLLEDSINKGSNIFTLSAIQRRFNNTQQLLDDKTSILFESQIQQAPQNPIKNLDTQVKDHNSFLFEEKDSIINNLNSSHSFNEELLSISNTTKTQNDIKKFQINPEIDYSNNPSLLSYGIVFPTSINKLQYKIKNVSGQSTLIEFKISEKNNLKEHFESYNDICNNSNIKHNCFHILNEQKKVVLNHNEEIAIQIELKTPFTKINENLFCLLEIYNNNFIDKSVPLVAQIEIPKICCLKSTQNATSECTIPVIPIKIELKTKGQRYRLPFRNMSQKDVEIEITIDIKKNKKDSFWFNYEYYKCQILFFPNNLVIPAQSTSNLEMIAKVSKGIIDENRQPSSSEQINQRSIRKVITVKIKGTKLTYSFFLEAFLFE